MTSDWRYYSLDALTYAVRDELPLGGFQVTERLKGVDSFSASIPLRHPKARPDVLDTESTLIAAVRDETLIWLFELLEADVSTGAEIVQLSGDGLWGVFRDRYIRSRQAMSWATADPATGGVRFTNRDQFHIVEDLINHTQSLPGGDLGITVGYTQLSGVHRDRTYEINGASIAELVENLADVQDGFDWHLDVGGSVDNITLTFRLSYPQRGRDTGYRFDGDTTGSGNLVAWGMRDTSRGRFSRFVALGEGEGRDQLVAIAEDPNLIGRLLLKEGSGSWMDVNRLPTLQAHANRALTVARRANRLPILVTRPGTEPQLSAVILGDRVHVRIDDGWMQIDGAFRVVGRTIDISDDGAETAAYELAEFHRFS